MTWINKRIPLLLIITIIIFLALIYIFNVKIKAGIENDNELSVAEVTLPASATPTATSSPVTKKIVIATAKPTATNKPTTAQENNDTGTTNSTNNSNTSSESNTTNDTSTTSAPTTVPVVATATPTAQPTTVPVEQANIQVWSRGWVYSNTGQQYSADGDIKIFNGSTQIASGSYNSYEEPYKVSNLPTNSTLTITFYMGSCGQAKTINTGSTSTLHQVDFSFNPTTVCL